MLAANILSVHNFVDLQNCENFTMIISFKGKITQPRKF